MQRELTDDLSRDDRYQRLLGLLLSSDDVLRKFNLLIPTQCLDLSEIWKTGQIHGQVYYWPRSPGQKARVDSHRAAKETRYALPESTFLHKMGCYWDIDQRFTRSTTCSSELEDRLGVQRIDLGRWPSRPSGPVALAPIFAKAFPYFEMTQRGGFRTQAGQYTDREALSQHLEELRPWAQKVSALLLPELMIDAVALSQLQDWKMPGTLMVAGSHHRHLPTADLWYNQATVFLSEDLKKGWVHRKQGYFRVPKEHAVPPKEPGQPHLFSNVPSTLDHDLIEEIERGCCLRFADTGLGRIVVLICADMLDPTAWTELRRLAPELVLVISMSTRSKEFLDRIKDFPNTDFLYVNTAYLSCLDGPQTEGWSERVLTF
ncbi:MAG TPA: hypothetical protein PLA94_29750, partial [Myxococcota bacterium]|nr:hypothetical protein [Myxococcota bacterium]